MANEQRGTFQNPASEVLWGYLDMLDRIYGMYSDCVLATAILAKKIDDLTEAKPGARIFFGRGPPNRDEAEYVHSVHRQDFIERNSEGGGNHVLLAQSTLVFAYSVWEHVRAAYADAVGQKTDGIKCDAVGDLRLYRNAIAHNEGVLNKPTSVLSFVVLGEHIVLSQPQMEELFSILFSEISSLNERTVGEALPVTFKRRLNPSGEFPNQSRSDTT